MPAKLTFIATALTSALALGFSTAALPAEDANDETLTVKVKQHDDGRIASIELIRTDSGRLVARAYPYGDLIGRVKSLPTQEMSMTEFRAYIAPLLDQTAPSQLKTGLYTTGLDIGYNDSIGAVSGQCYNFTTLQPVNEATNSDFKSSNSFSSIAQSTNIEASIQGSYDEFSASNDFTYSDSYDASKNSGSAYFSASATFSFNNTVDSDLPLTDQGEQALDSERFGSSCGSSYLSTVEGGMFVIGQLYWASSSSEQSSAFSDTFSASVGGGLDSLTTAVTTAKTIDKSSFSCGISYHLWGGGQSTRAIFDDIGVNQQYLSSCCQGDTDACTTYATAMSASFTTNVGQFADSVKASHWPAPDLGNVYLFPEGVAGTTNPRRTLPANDLGIDGDTSDPWAGVQQDLRNYFTVLNQLRTLENRADHLYNAVGKKSFNPTNLINLQSDLARLKSTFGNDIGDTLNPQPGTLFYHLNTCLSETTTSENADTQCAPITALNTSGIHNAYQWYESDNSLSDVAGNIFLAKQNTIALQYVSLFTNDNKKTWPLDVVYIDQLPPFTGNSKLEPIGKQAALTGFADATYYVGSTEENDSTVSFLPLNIDDKGLSIEEVYSTEEKQGVFLTEKATDNNIPSPGLVYLIRKGSAAKHVNSANSPRVWNSSTACQPSFTNPCGISYRIESGKDGAPKGSSMVQVLNFFTPGVGNSAGPQLSYGKAWNLGRPSKGRLRVTGAFELPDFVDLRTTRVSLDLLMFERGAGGAGGKGELILDGEGKAVTPTVLQRHRDAQARRAIYSTLSGTEPRIRAELKIDPRSPILHVSAQLMDGLIATPELCEDGQTTVELGFRMTVENEITRESRSLVSKQPWECRSRGYGSVQELRALAAP